MTDWAACGGFTPAVAEVRAKVLAGEYADEGQPSRSYDTGHKAPALDPRRCRACRAEFTPRRRDQHCCTRRCAQRQRDKRKQLAAVRRHCLLCGEEFVVNRPGKLYCSETCRVRAAKRRARASEYRLMPRSITE